jgi:hypothetical protein
LLCAVRRSHLDGIPSAALDIRNLVSPPLDRLSSQPRQVASRIVGGECDSDGVDVSAEAVANVPAENLRVSRAVFGALWALAEDLGRRPGDGGRFLLGVIRTCRWLADQPFWSQVDGYAVMPTSPYTRRRRGAMPETIEEEYLASLSPRGLEPELARGVAATLGWAWYGSDHPPLGVAAAAAG